MTRDLNAGDMSPQRPRVLEPQLDVPAGQDWSTVLHHAEIRSAACTVSALLPLLTVALALAAILPWTAGNGVAVVLLGVAGLVGLLGPVTLLIERRHRRRGLLTRPWRRCPAEVAVVERRPDLDHVIVWDGPGPTVLRGVMRDVVDVVSARRELFLLGPDEDGHAAVRVAGLCTTFRAERTDSPARPSAPVVVPPCPPPDDRAMRSLRRGARAVAYPAVIGVAGVVVGLVGLSPLSPTALVVGGVLLGAAAVSFPAAAALGRHHAQALAGARAATGWTSLPVALFPWAPTDVVAGSVMLPTGTGLVRFPLPDLDVIANVADTGTVWIRGPVPGGTATVAVGVPGVPRLTFAVVRHGRDAPPERPLPWLVRTYARART